MQILLVGCGKMGGAMLRRWLGTNIVQFTVAAPNGGSVPDGVRHVRSAAELGDQVFDMLIIAVKPQMIDDALPPYMAHLAPGGCLVSIAAGYSSARLTTLVGDHPVIRLMPNLPAMIGQGVNGLFANALCEAVHRDAATALAEATGSAIWVEDEDKIDRITAVAGSGSGYVFEIARSYAAAAEALGFDTATARTLVLDTLAGAIEMARQSDQPLETLRNDVTSKNGTTQAGLGALMRDGQLDALLENTIKAAYARAIELR
ncbi:pyrroline-5-carboxylate reductase [uncultured Maricaulis sp.]|uniref:pyrroline-5-carboxylate reductase family protein n=1 Tax=uncultured Maricaulis sp. TaxID=174710 RepID=UPI0030DBCFE3